MIAETQWFSLDFRGDTRDALLLDVEIKAYLTGATPGGKGPSFADRARKQHEAEVRRAKSTGREMFSSPEGLLVDAGSSHKPPSQKKKATKSKGPGLPPPQVLSQTINPPPTWQPRYPASHGADPALPQPQVLSQSVNPPPTWQPSYPASHGAANMIQPRIQTFSLPPVHPQPPVPQPPLHQPSFPLSPMPSAGLQPSWNSSMSPSIYELIITPQTVRKCYGCGNDLGDKYKTPPCNYNKACRQTGHRKRFCNRSANTQSGLFKHVLSFHSGSYNQKESAFFRPSLRQVWALQLITHSSITSTRLTA